MNSLNVVADNFIHAFYKREWPDNSTQSFTNLSIQESYQVQDIVAKKRIEKGERVAGFKVGCTSKAIRSQFGLKEPIHGRIFIPRVYRENIKIDWNDYVNCAIEPEMVFCINRDLKGLNLSDKELIKSIEYVSPGIELHNFKFWHSPPTIQELICSGGIHAGLVVGDSKVSPRNLSFCNELFSVYKDDELVTSTLASEIMGGPLHSLRWLVNSLTQNGSFLKKNSLVIPSSPTELVKIEQDTQLKITIDNVGSATTIFEKKDKTNP